MIFLWHYSHPQWIFRNMFQPPPSLFWNSPIWIFSTFSGMSGRATIPRRTSTGFTIWPISCSAGRSTPPQTGGYRRSSGTSWKRPETTPVPHISSSNAHSLSVKKKVEGGGGGGGSSVCCIMMYRWTWIWRTTIWQIFAYDGRYAWSQSDAYQVFVICIRQILHMTDQFSWSHWVCHIQVHLY